jgi:predicted FMN-binding regulatory protein PaiB
MDDVGHMLQGIVAYRMVVDTLEGKFKLGQNRLTQFYDSAHPGYTMDDVGHMLQGIVAYRMVVDTLEGKFKLGQNRPMADRVGMREQLEQSHNQRSQALAKLMRTYEPEE